jgi:putative heme-binding domain-containing protein
MFSIKRREKSALKILFPTLCVTWCCLWISLCGLTSEAHAQGAVSSLRRLLDSGRVPPERQGQILEMICTRGEPDDLAVPFNLLNKPGALKPELQRKVVELLTEAATTRNVKPSGDLSPLAKLIDGPEAAKDRRLTAAAIRLAGVWKLAEVNDTISKLAASDKSNAALRQAAIDALASIGGATNQKALEQLAVRDKLNAIRIYAAAGLSRLDTAAATTAAAKILAEVSASDDINPLIDSILSRKDGADKLAAALKANKPPRDAAKMALREMYAIGRSDAELSNILSEAAGIALDVPPPSQEEVAKIAVRVTEQGDAARGEKIFRRADLSCMKCHAVSQAGGSVGPDLSPVGSISPADYIVNSILNPNLAVKEQFVTRRVLTADGEIITGIQIDRDDQRLRLRDATGKTIVIPIANIDQEDEGKSLMPQGITKFLTDQEFLDLARFVSELGKPGPYAIRKTPSLQRWRVLKNPAPELTSEVPNVELFREHVLDASPGDWLPAYGMVGGNLPLAELAKQRPAVVYIQGEIEVSEAGPVTIDINSTEATQTWLDAEPFEATKQITRELTAGRHTLTFRVAITDRPDPTIKIEFSKPSGSTAQFSVVSGM